MIDVVPLREMDNRLRQQWVELCDISSAPFDSPFYRPEFAELIDQVRGDVELAVVEEAGQVAAMLPFHRLRGTLGLPVGLHLNDFQGFIGRLPESVRPIDVLRTCGLQAWDFDHVPVQQSEFTPYVALTDISPYVDLSNGLAAYEQTRDSKLRNDSARRLRKLTSEHGEVRFEHGAADRRVLDTLLAWKRDQFARTAVPDVLAEDWVREAVALLADQVSLSFAGVTSSLWAGDRLIAADLSPRTANVFHGQWCAYDPEFQAYSPGRLLYESMIRWVTDQGISRVECGKGDQDYKLRAATHHHLVATGSVAAGPYQRVVRGAWWKMRRWARSSALRPHLKAAAGYYYRLRRAAPLRALRGSA